MDTMDESMDLDELFDDTFQSGSVQEIRRSRMHKSMMQVARAAERASHLVMNIVEQNEGRMQLDEHNHLLIVGNLGIYRVDLGSFMTKFANPFDYNSLTSLAIPKWIGEGTKDRLCPSSATKGHACLRFIRRLHLGLAQRRSHMASREFESIAAHAVPNLRACSLTLDSEPRSAFCRQHQRFV